MNQPTMDDVAAHAGVSRALVSLVMRDSPRVSDASRKKVLASANELGYRPNVWARNLASGQTNTIGVMLNEQPESMDTVCNDEAHGSELVVEHLTSLGHNRIAHIDAGEAPGAPERRRGFMTSMSDRGLAPIVFEGDFNEHAGMSAAAQLMKLKEPPTAIFAANDLSATGVLAHLRSIGARVPEDISIVGYDDTLLAGLGALSLTTVHQPLQLFGRRATELLLERIEGRTVSKHELIEPQLVTRSSTGPA